jgi:hypothetical protein
MQNDFTTLIRFCTIPSLHLQDHTRNGPFPCPPTSSGMRPLPTSQSALRCTALRLFTMHKRRRAVRGTAERIDTGGDAAKCCPISRDSDCREGAGQRADRTGYCTTKNSDIPVHSSESIAHVCATSGQHIAGRHHAVIFRAIGGCSAGTMCRGRYTTAVRPGGYGWRSLTTLANIRDGVNKHNSATTGHQSQCIQSLATEPR